MRLKRRLRLTSVKESVNEGWMDSFDTELAQAAYYSRRRIQDKRIRLDGGEVDGMMGANREVND
jgi:hypothetical protein